MTGQNSDDDDYIDLSEEEEQIARNIFNTLNHAVSGTFIPSAGSFGISSGGAYTILKKCKKCLRELEKDDFCPKCLIYQR